MRLKQQLFALAIGFFFSTLGATEWDLEYWQYVRFENWKSKPYSIYTIGEVRLRDDLSQFYYYRIAENFAYQALPHLDLEAHYSYIYYKTRTSMRFNSVNRFEFEANPDLTLCNGIQLIWRNRLELLKKQDIKHFQFVIRQRLMAVIPIECAGKLTAIHVYDEVFYDFDTHKFTQNRFAPLELTFQLTERVTIDVFLMARHFFSLSSSKWYRSIVLGSALRF